MTDDLRELARLLPDPAPDELPGPRHHALRERLMQEMTEAGTDAAAVPPALRRRRRILIPAIASGLVMVLMALWVTSALVLGVGKFWAGRTPAGDLLDRIALVAAQSDDLPPLDHIRNDQFIYIETYGGASSWGVATTLPDDTITYVDGWEPIRPRQRELWTSVDGSRSGLMRDPNNVNIASEHCEPGTCNGTDITTDPQISPSVQSPTFRYLQSLPTNPDLLLLTIYRQTWGMGQNRQQEAFTAIGDLLRVSLVPPDLAGALYQAAARIPGVTVVDDSVDALGRHGIAVARTDEGGIREEWIFDRDTLQFLGERAVVTGGFQAPVAVNGTPSSATSYVGTVIESTAIVARAVVDHAGDVPA